MKRLIVISLLLFALLFSCYASVGFSSGVFVSFYGSAVANGSSKADKGFFANLCPGIKLSLDTQYFSLVSRMNWSPLSEFFRGSFFLDGVLPIGNWRFKMGLGYRYNISIEDGFSWGDGISKLKLSETPVTFNLDVDIPVSSSIVIDVFFERPTLFIPAKMNLMDIKYQTSDKNTSQYLLLNTFLGIGVSFRF